MKKIKMLTIAQRRAKNGRLYILPFTLGFIFFFLQPLVLSLYYSFTTITPSEIGYDFVWSGLKNYNYLFNTDVAFKPALVDNVQMMITKMIVITLLSIFFAVILNQKFRGRTFVRAVAFFPVIISSGIIISILHEDIFNTAMSLGNSQATNILQSSGLNSIMTSAHVPTVISNLTSSAVSKIFDMLWDSGVQIIIFLAALQNVPGQLYEAAKVEGATAWESFWKITFPMISPMILISVIYTIIDSFTNYSNPVMKLITKEGITNMRYSYACAMSWMFLTFVIIIVACAYLIIDKLLVRNIR